MFVKAFCFLVAAGVYCYFVKVKKVRCFAPYASPTLTMYILAFSSLSSRYTLDICGTATAKASIYVIAVNHWVGLGLGALFTTGLVSCL